MSIFNRFKKLNWSETGAHFAGGFKGTFARLKSKLTGARAYLKEHFPKNMEELKDDLQRLQSGEALERIRTMASGGSSGTYLRLGAAAFAAYFLADTVSLFTDSLIPDAPPVPPAPIVRKDEKRRSMDEYAAIITRNIFNSQGLIPEPEGMAANGPARKTNLPFNLIGTVVLKNETKSIATIEDKSQNMVFPVRIDDTIADKVTITKIEHLKVYFINKSTGGLEYVEIVEDFPQIPVAVQTSGRKPIGGADGVSKTDDTHVEITRDKVEKTMGNLSKVLQDARAIPNFENGMPDGYKILQIVPGSIYEQLGIKNGDVICGLNGDPINDPGKAFAMFNELKTASHLEICVKRGGQKSTMNYDIK